MNTNSAHVTTWVRSAYALAFSSIVWWAGITALYLILATLVLGLPFVGGVLLVFLTPAVIAGVLKEAANPRPATSPLLRLADVFIGALRDRELALSVMSVATILLGAWVFLSVVAMILGIGSLTLPGLFAHRGLVGAGFTALLLLIFWGLQVGLVTTALYVLAGIVLGALKPIDALERTVALWRAHPAPLGALGLVLVLPLILAFYGEPWVRIVVAVVTLVPLTLAVYVSYGMLRPEAVAGETP